MVGNGGNGCGGGNGYRVMGVLVHGRTRKNQEEPRGTRTGTRILVHGPGTLVRDLVRNVSYFSGTKVRFLLF